MCTDTVQSLYHVICWVFYICSLINRAVYEILKLLSMTDIAESDSGELNLGHNGIGDGCVEKVINYSGKFFIAGEQHMVLPRPAVECALFGIIVGGVFGSVEGCFLTPIPGSTRPMIFRCLGLMLNRSILFGKVITK